jgi:hypothetical protein
MTDVMRWIVIWWVQEDWIMNGIWIDCLLKYKMSSQ